MFNGLELLIFYVYGIPLLLIVFRIAKVLWTERQESTHNKLFSYFAINGCALYVLNNFALRLPSVKFFYDRYFSKVDDYPTFYFLISFFRNYCEYFFYFNAVLLAINRFMAVYNHARCEVHWKGRRWYYLIFLICGPFFACYHYLIASVQVRTFQLENRTIAMMMLKSKFHDVYPYFEFESMALVSFEFGIIAFVGILLMWKQRVAENKIPEKERSYELKLIWITVIIYCIGILAFLHSWFFHLLPNYFIWLVINDAVALLPPCLLLFASPSLRAKVLPQNVRQRAFDLYIDFLLIGISLDAE
ncbi:hypothetical protein M3Y97_00191800 [Aphelenchoides bicaudatus]|nr:hypothetical protein M3Y97_00191800 [Aphelenchoides bicaudatus]